MPRKSSSLGAEKRRATRMHVEGTVTIWPINNGSPGPATRVLTRDLSFSGIGFLQAAAQLPAGQFILQLPRAKGPLLMLCQITFARTLADQLHVIGAEFVRVLTPHAAVAAPRCNTADAADAAAALDALCDKLVKAPLPANGSDKMSPAAEPALASAKSN